MNKVKMQAQSLKLSSVSVGAGILHYDCYFIQEAFSSGNEQAMQKRYNRLIEDGIEFMDYCEQYLNSSKHPVGAQKLDIQPFDVSKDLYLSNGYSIQRINDKGIEYLCLSPDQT